MYSISAFNSDRYVVFMSSFLTVEFKSACVKFYHSISTCSFLTNSHFQSILHSLNHGTNSLLLILGILASPGYPSCNSGLMSKHLELRTWKNHKVRRTNGRTHARTDIREGWSSRLWKKSYLYKIWICK